MEFPFVIVSGRTIHEILHADLTGCAEQVRAAYIAHGQQKTVNPSSYFLTFPEKPGCRIIALPAYVGAGFDVSGIKWIASYPENIKKGFPRASAVLILNSYETGYPFAVLESSIISAARTAASAVLAAEACTRGEKRVGTLGIVGTGLIARYVYTFLMASGWSVQRILLHDLAADEAARFAKESLLAERHERIESSDLETVVRGSDLLVLTTVASTPYIHDPRWFAHHPVVLNISLRDLAPEVCLASYNVVDDVDHCLKANTSPHLAEQKVGHREFIQGTIPEMLDGRLRLERDKPIIVSPFGLGVLDLAVGKWVHDRALEEGRVTQIEDFFFELRR